jgi:hypothetical protein
VVDDAHAVGAVLAKPLAPGNGRRLVREVIGER